MIRPPGLLLDGPAVACREPGFGADVRLHEVGEGGDVRAQVSARGLQTQVVVSPQVSLIRARQLVRGAMRWCCSVPR